MLYEIYLKPPSPSFSCNKSCIEPNLLSRRVTCFPSVSAEALRATCHWTLDLRFAYLSWCPLAEKKPAGSVGISWDLPTNPINQPTWLQPVTLGNLGFRWCFPALRTLGRAIFGAATWERSLVEGCYMLSTYKGILKILLTVTTSTHWIICTKSFQWFAAQRWPVAM